MLQLKQLVTISLLCVAINSYAQISETQINTYNQIAQQQGGDLDKLHKEIQLAQHNDPADAWTLFYLGATETLVGRDALMPWNKMSYTENGLARINKALTMIGDKELREHYHSLPKSLYMQANAATSFTQVPEFFNTFDQGYQLFQQLLSDPVFQHLPPQATSWVYYQALLAAKKAEDHQQAQSWYQALVKTGINDSYTQQATALMQGES